MLRATVCVMLIAAGAASAGELDREPAPGAASVAASAPAAAPGTGGSEMDCESPQSAHGWRWGGPYYRGWGGWGWGGFYSAPVSYFNIGFGSAFYRPFGFYGGFYNYGYYRPYFPAYYYPPAYYGWWW